MTAILATGLLVMSIYRVQYRARVPGTGPGVRVHHRRAAIAIVISLAAIAVPLTLVSVHINTIRTTENQVSNVASAWAAAHGWTIVSVATQPDGVLVRATGPLPEPETGSLQTALAQTGLGDTAVAVELIPSDTVQIRSNA